MVSAPETLRLDAALTDAILPLRTRVLRPHLAPGRLAHFEGDDHPHTRHFAAWRGEEVVGVLSLFQNPMPGNTPPAWQLRGMAVAPEVQGQGVGGRLLEHALTRQALADPTITWVWCNARQRAVPFYERHGFAIVSPLFDIEGVGPHVRMARTLPTLLV
ncbi:GNAT family N-acetyltransferase [Bradymonadaceae bacterium TMQ3]|uniref:GNAT family N-acetyltransferase n=1 Tax=Lujinxingia sediminis TaxID=2480984 RepID=A0ABY0CQU5_9DELT|nr:GNAT family N-acetyltransferase [Lujinxingia sediminis]RDV37131.1 GNAT family N-acetyltransferase [Bradymonadaceae bacterium TMQ3]RVU42425.1 GNAT family N-acetyltransferase [Lujinxingia sediminis]TXC74625.1 GNAT family N-acetyltransferase [Bradymonadales bacterium TMQ1]